jgi:hypothetical protein
MDVSDARLRVPLQLCERRTHALPVRQSKPVNAFVVIWNLMDAALAVKVFHCSMDLAPRELLASTRNYSAKASYKTRDTMSELSCRARI